MIGAQGQAHRIHPTFLISQPNSPEISFEKRHDPKPILNPIGLSRARISGPDGNCAGGGYIWQYTVGYISSFTAGVTHSLRHDYIGWQ